MVQQELLFDDRDRWRLIRGLRVESLTRLQTGRVRRVLEAIYVAQGSSGGNPVSRRLEDLAERLDCSLDSARRWIHLAEDHRLIVVEAATAHGGRQANTYAIHWERLRELATAPQSSQKPSVPTNGGPPSQNARAPSQNARAPSQNARAPSQNARAYIEDLVQVDVITLTPPPTLISAPEPRWEEVEDQLRQVGVIFASQACEGSHSRGLVPSRVLALIEHYRSHPGAWNPGALFRRIEIDHPDIGIGDGWPPPTRENRQDDLIAQARAILAERNAL